MTLLRPTSGIRFAGTGAYLPERIVTTDEIARREGSPLTAAEITKMVGIDERRWAADHEATSDLAIAAGRMALLNANATMVDRVLLSTSSGDYLSPATACIVQRGLSLAPAAASDVSAACAGFLFALDHAARALLTGDTRVLVVASDIRSRYVDPLDRATCALYGDGAGAAVLEHGPSGEGLLALYLAADGTDAETIYIPAGGSRKPASPSTLAEREHYLRIADGPRVFLTALEGMSKMADELLAATGHTLADIDLVVPHQPNRMILDRLCRYMRIPQTKMFVNVHRTGNLSSASMAVALHEAMQDERAKPGALIMLVGGGAGFCGGAALIRVPSTKGNS
jgi:3-oxoacyl-[acyl-carrier-protein] synthase III